MTIGIDIDVETGRPIGNPGDPRLNPAPATVRQIAHEVLESLRPKYRKVITYQARGEYKPLLGQNGIVELGDP